MVLRVYASVFPLLIRAAENQGTCSLRNLFYASWFSAMMYRIWESCEGLLMIMAIGTPSMPMAQESRQHNDDFVVWQYDGHGRKLEG